MMSEKVERAECGDEEGCNSGIQESRQQPQQPQQPRNHLMGRIEAGLAEMRGRLGLVEAGLKAACESGDAVREKVSHLEEGVALLEGHSFSAARGHARVAEELEDVEVRLEAAERRLTEAAFEKVKKVKRSNTISGAAFRVGCEDEKSGDCGGGRTHNKGGRRREKAAASPAVVPRARSLTDLTRGASSGVAVPRRCGSFSSLLSFSSSSSSTSPPSPSPAAFVSFIENEEKSVRVVDQTEKKSKCDDAATTKAAVSERRSYSRLFLDLSSSLPGIMRSKSFNDVRGSKQKPEGKSSKVGKSEREDFKAPERLQPSSPSSHLLVIDTSIGGGGERPAYPPPLLEEGEPQHWRRCQTRTDPPLRSNSMKEATKQGQGKGQKKATRAINRHANMSWNAADFRERNNGGGRDTRSLSSRTGSLASLGTAASPDHLRRAASMKAGGDLHAAKANVTFRDLLREEALLAKVGYLDLKKTSGFTKGYKTVWCALSRDAVLYVFPFKSGSSADRMLKASERPILGTCHLNIF